MSHKYEAGEVLHLVRTITHHVEPGSGLIQTTGLYKKTHVTVLVMGKTIDRAPTMPEILHMFARHRENEKLLERKRVATEEIEYRIFKDGDVWCATDSLFKNLAESNAGFGNTPQEAICDFIANPK